MIKLARNLTILAAAISLSGCLKVDDNGNKKVAEALNNQNQILQQQADQAAQEKTSLSVTGTIKNLSTQSAATEATLTFKTGSVTASATAKPDGSFQIDNVPLDSDYTLIVHSASGAFMDRAIFGKTRASNSSGSIYQDLGQLNVAAGIEHKYKILNTVTNAPITGLNLRANSEIGTASGYEQYLHKSTYDADTQEYKITLPEHLGVSVYASLDLNNDGKLEYRPENNAYGYNELEISDTDNHNTIYLVDLQTNNKIEVRVSLLDWNLQPLLGAHINIDDNLNGNVSGSYDSTKNQYVVDGVMDDSLTVRIPSFSVGSVTYASASIQINKSTANQFSAYVGGDYPYTAQFSYPQEAEKTFDVVLRPSTLNLASSLMQIGTNATVNQSNTSFSIFYSGAVSIKPESVTLVKKNVLHVVRGNDSDTDTVLPGTTLVENVDQPVTIHSQVGLNNTLLTAATDAPLEGGYTYLLSVGTLKDLFVNQDIDLYGDLVNLAVAPTTPFSIDDLQLDNNDFYTNGAIIKTTNTAGDVAAPYNSYWGNSVTLYLPLSVENLKTLTLRKEQITFNNATTSSVYTYNVVANGSFNYCCGTTSVVSVAYNESLTGNLYYNIVRGAGIPDGIYHAVSLYDSLPDNTAGAANSITFSYVYETKDGITATGTITLPVH